MKPASELDYHGLSDRDLEILARAGWEGLDVDITEVARMLTSPIQKLQADRSRRRRPNADG